MKNLTARIFSNKDLYDTTLVTNTIAHEYKPPSYLKTNEHEEKFIEYCDFIKECEYFKSLRIKYGENLE